MTLPEMVRKYRCGAKLRDAVIAARGWRRPNHKTGDEGEWFERWPVFSVELETAIKEARAA